MPTRIAALTASLLCAGAALAGCAQAPTATIGECVESEDLSGADVTSIPTVSCDKPHDLEVYHTFDLPGAHYPGDADVAKAAEDGCYDAFEDYVGAPYEESELYFMFLHPGEDSWSAAKDREVICLLESPEPVTGSLRGSGR